MAVKKVKAAKKPGKKPAAAAKKTAPKVAAVKKAAPVATKTTPIGEKQTKSAILSAIAEETGLPRKDVSSVFASLSGLVLRHMRKRGSGEFSIPEVGVKIRRIRKPATKARKMISPFSGEEITVKAKPAREVVKVTALKGLKETASM